MPISQSNRQLAINTPLGEDKLLIVNASITEQLGRLFQIDVDLASDDASIDFDAIVGGNATIRLDLVTSKVPRFFNGYVSRFAQTGADNKGGSYRATLVPWLWFLTRTADCRIFQNKTVPDIIKQVFRDHGFTDFKDSLNGTYTEWEYCVQYRETDFNFVSRLMEHEGIYYFFEHENGKHTLVLADASSAHSAFTGYEKVPYRVARGSTNVESIGQWIVEQEVQPGTYTVNDFNFEKPKTSLVAQSNIPTQNAQSSFAVYDYPAEYEEQSEGSDYAKIRIEELHTQHEIARGDSNARGLAVGYTFELTSSPRRDQNRQYLLTSASYRLAADNYNASEGTNEEETFSCTFTALDVSKPFRAARTTPKPTIQGPQTAIVVGTSGEEIYTDQYGRIKVQFHWDRYGKSDENSSCWVRLSQAAWAGKKWGSIYIPRIGQEVIVEFLEGDPDRPIVTGRVYNADAMPPYTLPAEKTKTTLKSASSKGAAGFNELRFEDKKGSEQIFIHAEKDYHDRVKNDRLEWIGNNRHLIVTQDQYEAIKGDKHEDVTGELNQKIGETLSVKAGMNIQEKAGMNIGTEAGMELHLKAGMNVVIEAGMSITLKAGAGFVVVGPAGVTISGEPVLINSGGAAGAGEAISPTAPTAPKEADDGTSGDVSSVTPGTPAEITATTTSSVTVALRVAAEDGSAFIAPCPPETAQADEEGPA